jgi:hypothetical protein
LASGSHRSGYQPGIGEGREFGQPHTIGKVRPQLAPAASGRQCWPSRLPMRGDEIQDLAELLLRPISSETGFCTLVGDRTDVCSAVATPAPNLS